MFSNINDSITVGIYGLVSFLISVTLVCDLFASDV